MLFGCVCVGLSLALIILYPICGLMASNLLTLKPLLLYVPLLVGGILSIIFDSDKINIITIVVLIICLCVMLII